MGWRWLVLSVKAGVEIRLLQKERSALARLQVTLPGGGQALVGLQKGVAMVCSLQRSHSFLPTPSAYTSAHTVHLRASCAVRVVVLGRSSIMHVPILFSIPLQCCYQVGAFSAGHCGVVQSTCLLAVQHRVGHFSKSLFHNPCNMRGVQHSSL